MMELKLSRKIKINECQYLELPFHQQKRNYVKGQLVEEDGHCP